jgi:hypothetical protein
VVVVVVVVVVRVVVDVRVVDVGIDVDVLVEVSGEPSSGHVGVSTVARVPIPLTWPDPNTTIRSELCTKGIVSAGMQFAKAGLL